MQRILADELLDTDSGTAGEVAGALRDLRDLNSLFGGVGFTAKLLHETACSRRLSSISVLDTGGGDGFILKSVAQRLEGQGIKVSGVVLDRAPTHLNGALPVGRKVCGDALALPFADNAFDVVMSNLFVHHLEMEEVQRYVRDAMRVAKFATVINDLERNWLHWRLAQAAGLVYRSRLTRNDAPVSVRRAFTMFEMTNLLQPLGFRFRVTRGFFFRLGVLIWKD